MQGERYNGRDTASVGRSELDVPRALGRD